MTNEEAIEILKQFKKCLSDVVFDEKGSEAWQMAIKALEQQPCEDAISRDELLKAIDTWDKFGCNADTKLVPVKDCYVPYIHYDDVVKCIKGMPSVTPNQEPMREFTEDEAKAYSKTLDKMYKPTGFNVFDEPCDEIDFVQPHKKISVTLDLTLCDDAISREAVLDYLKTNVDDFPDYHEAIEKVLQMPPVTPNHGKMLICPSCGLDVHSDFKYCPRCGCKMCNAKPLDELLDEIKADVEDCIRHSRHFTTSRACCGVRDDVLRVIDKYKGDKYETDN